ncbi:hypothetical protein NDU88_003247 [Pleurodeles waltl]|uniref:Uncharacterized protein n=1 Tax=Pleurodeles waltl TaxID=8319 RepID=A0AAV7WQZ2_PLEWA|nr:hypothetical protein NDU88_003247 [Pleurodeles waltl]
MTARMTHAQSESSVRYPEYPFSFILLGVIWQPRQSLSIGPVGGDGEETFRTTTDKLGDWRLVRSCPTRGQKAVVARADLICRRWQPSGSRGMPSQEPDEKLGAH